MGNKIEFRTTPTQGHQPSAGLRLVSNNVQGDRGVASQECSGQGPRGNFRLYKHPVSSAQGQQHLAAGAQHETTELFCGIAPLESARSVKYLVQPGDWSVKLDLKDVYLAVPMHQPHQSFLRFQWQRQFKLLPFGLCSGPYTFMKPVVACLRRLGVRIILYLDNMHLLDQSKTGLLQHLASAVKLLVSRISVKKSVLSPTRKLEFLGLLIDSSKMLISDQRCIQSCSWPRTW